MLAYHRLSSSYEAYLSTITKETKPRSFHETCHQTVWQKAMHEELQALDDNHTGGLYHFQRIKRLLEVIGYTRSNSRQMVPLKDIKQDWLHKVSLKHMA
jgi:hypothetical protein